MTHIMFLRYSVGIQKNTISYYHNTMKLNYQYWSGPANSDTKNDVPIVIVPGLFGSIANWRRFANELSEHCSVYVVDMRNHGQSPHADSHRYQDMVSDLRQFLQDQKLAKVNLCGHSMGGKAAMLFAMTYPDSINSLMVLDIAPVAYKHSHKPYLKALMALDLTQLKSRSEADKLLREAIPETDVRLFLLQSLGRTATDSTDNSSEYEWRLNLPVLYDDMAEITGFPEHLIASAVMTKPTLIMRGANSDYVHDDHQSIFKQLFPNAQFCIIDQAGHWLHIEQREAVLDAIKKFVLNA